MPGPWNDATDKQLLLGIIHLTAPQLPKWDQVAALMGDGFTAESVRQHFAKLRRECKDEFGASAANGAKTPAKRGAGKKANGEASAKKSTGKRKAGKEVNGSPEGDQDDEEQSPSKKPKTEVKVEAEDDDQEDLL